MRASNYMVANYVFRGAEYAVSIEVDDTLLIIEVEEKATLNQWRGEFDIDCKFKY